MSSFTYRKIICTSGHSSGALPLERPLPRRCPECGRPYDRRYNIPVFCLEDGTVPEEADPAEPEKQMVQIKQADMPPQAVGIRRRRSMQMPYGGGEPGQDEHTDRGIMQNIVLCGDGRKIPVPFEKEYLGREGLGADIFLMNLLVSRRHAQICKERFGNVYVKDEDSLNGTFVDDGNGRRRLLPGESAELKPGDKLWLADQLLVIGEE